MNNNLPIECKTGVIYKFKKVFLNLFRNRKVVKTIPQEELKEKLAKEEITQSDIFLHMREESKKTNLKEDIFNMVHNNPELLKTLTLEQLKEIDKMYDQKIAEKEKKINKLKRELE